MFSRAFRGGISYEIASRSFIDVNKTHQRLFSYQRSLRVNIRVKIAVSTFHERSGRPVQCDIVRLNNLRIIRISKRTGTPEKWEKVATPFLPQKTQIVVIKPDFAGRLLLFYHGPGLFVVTQT